MYIQAIHIHQFRNITQLQIPCSPDFNVFYGVNGAGKTSLLEAIYTLSHSKSFRSHQVKHIIQHDNHAFQLYCELITDDQTTHTIGLERSISGDRKVKLDGETVQSASEIARLLPTQLITIDSYRYFTDGPKARREFLDWGVFHVKHAFIAWAKEFQHVLKQRNAALKAKAANSEIIAWNNAFIEASDVLTNLRREYIRKFIPIYQNIIAAILNIKDIELKFSCGWDEAGDLKHALEENYYKDLALGYTTIGPQRADLQLYLDETPAHEILSQGQQKLASYALQIAQGQYYQLATGRAPIYLIDDMPSELDPHKRFQVTKLISDMNAQVFMTGITTQDLNDVINTKNRAVRLFHVEHGTLNESISEATSA